MQSQGPRQRPHVGKLVAGLLITAIVISYPFLIYYYSDNFSPAVFAGFLLLMVLSRFIIIGNKKRVSDAVVLLVVVTFCITTMFLNNASWLKFYPVLMNIGVGLTFIVSLNDEQCLIERFAQLSGNKPPAAAQGYLRTLTLLWGLLLFINGAISAYTAWYTPLSTWAFYNGFVAYLVMGVFAVAEWLYRQHYKKKHNIIDEQH